MGWTDTVSRQGKMVGDADVIKLFLREFGGMVIEAWKETNSMEGFMFQKRVESGKSALFPIIGRKRDAIEHTPGNWIEGGIVEHNEVEITLDPILVDSFFTAEIDDLMNHFSVAEPYARQLAESLSVTYDKRAVIQHIKAARITAAPYTGGPVPLVPTTHANMNTDPTQIETAFFAARQSYEEKDISAERPTGFLRPAQFLLCAKASTLDMEVTTGTGDRGKGQIGQMAGLNTRMSNHIPSTNIATGNTKYQGNFTKTTGFISSPMAVGCLNLREMRVSLIDQPERLGKLGIASKATGMGALRPEVAHEFGTP